MKILSDCGLILKRPEGNWIFYRINEEAKDSIKRIEELIEKI